MIGEMPVYIRITVDGQSKEMTTSRKCDPKYGIKNPKGQMVKREFIKELNNHLTTLKVKVFEARLSLIENNKPVTVESIKNLLHR